MILRYRFTSVIHRKVRKTHQKAFGLTNEAMRNAEKRFFSIQNVMKLEKWEKKSPPNRVGLAEGYESHSTGSKRSSP